MLSRGTRLAGHAVGGMRSDERVHSWARVYGSSDVCVCAWDLESSSLCRESRAGAGARARHHEVGESVPGAFLLGAAAREESSFFLLLLLSFFLPSFLSLFFSLFFFAFPFFGLYRGRGRRAWARARAGGRGAPPFLFLVAVMPELARDARRVSRKTELIAVDLRLRKRR